MGFTLSGSTITQTGTDHDLSGLSGIAGVVIYNLLDKVVYEVPHRINVTGNLTQLANEVIHSTFVSGIFLQVTSTGNYRIYGNIDGNVTTSNIANAQLVSNVVAARSFPHTEGILIQGVLRLIGGHIKCPAPLNFFTGAKFVVRGGCFESGVTLDGDKGMLRCSQAGINFDVEDFILYNSNSAKTGNNYTQFIGFSPRNCQEGILDITTGLPPLEIVDFLPENCDSDLAFIQETVFIVTGVSDMAPPKVSVHFNRNNVPAGGKVEYRKIVNFTVKDLEGNKIEEAKIYTKDTNQPTARDYSNAFFINERTGNHILTEESYLQVTDVNGEAQIDKITAFAGVYPNETSLGGVLIEVMYKTKAVDHLFRDDFFIVHYNYIIQTLTDVPLTGIGVKEVQSIVFTDTVITELDKSIVEGYTEINTPTAFYDRAKLYLLDHYAGETETIVTRIDDTIDARNYNVVLDSNAINVFDFDGNTITIKTNAFTGNIKTTGVVTLNGATINGGIIDANGDSFLSFLGVLTDWELYDNQADAKSFQNELASGAYNEIYRFNFTGQKDYYYRIAGVLDKLTVSESGETAVDLSLAAQIKRLNTNMITYDMVKGLVNSARDKVLSAIQMIF